MNGSVTRIFGERGGMARALSYTCALPRPMLGVEDRGVCKMLSCQRSVGRQTMLCNKSYHRGKQRQPS